MFSSSFKAFVTFFFAFLQRIAATAPTAITTPAITYLLTKQKCDYSIPYQTYVDDAFKNSDYIKTIDSLGTDIRVFSHPLYAGKSAMEYVDNYTSTFSAGLSSIKVWDFIKQTAKVSAFRGMPYLFKTRFSYDTDALNSKV